jgi:hypothetical protein
MTEAAVSIAGNLTDQPELRHTEGGIARAVFRVAVSGRREQEASLFTVIVWRDQAEHVPRVAGQGQPGGGRWSAPAAGLDGWGWQRPIGGRGRGRGAGAKPAPGGRNADQGNRAGSPLE